MTSTDPDAQRVEHKHPIGQRVRHYRARAGISLTRLADAAGMGKSYLSEIENGHKATPSAVIISRLADALGVTPNDLLDVAPPPVHCRHWAIQWVTAPGSAIECQSCGKTWTITEATDAN